MTGTTANRAVGGFEFRLAAEIGVVRNSDGSVYVDRPQSRYSGAPQAKLHKYGEGEFCRFRVGGLPAAEGVYCVFADEDLRYVGEAVDLRKRWYGYGHISPKNCYEGGRETNCRVNKLILQRARQEVIMTLWFLLTTRRKAVEAELRQRFRPPWNRV